MVRSSDLTPVERQALEFIIENADLIDVGGSVGFLLIQAPPELLDILACVGAEAEDRENDLEDEEEHPIPRHTELLGASAAVDAGGEDSEPDYDNEPDNRFGPACPCELKGGGIGTDWSCSVHDKPGPDIKLLSANDKARTPKRN